MSQSNNQTMPIPSDKPDDKKDPTLALIRDKVSHLYDKEPSALDEEKEIASTGVHSVHQKFMQELINSGKSLAAIQTAWHQYYQGLDDEQKKQVWQEFYANNPKTVNYFANAAHQKKPTNTPQPQPSRPVATNPKQWFVKDIDYKSGTAIDPKQEVLQKVRKRNKISKKQHFQSLLFGISMGVLVIFIVMFSFFNEKFIAPFITPSRVASSSPMILDPNNSGKVDPAPKIIIPKINVEVPVVYGTNSIAEDDIQASLENGAVHYPTSPVPGQNGNVVLVGHSSSNIFNRGKYKFAFVLLNKLEVNDTFLINYNGQRYIYKIYSKKIVKPSDTSVLDTADKPATATLITCDPPGSNINRLVLLAEQISPGVNTNTVATNNKKASDQAAIVPGNSPSLFSRLFSWINN